MRNHKNAIRLILSSALALSVLSGCSSQSQETAADPARLFFPEPGDSRRSRECCKQRQRRKHGNR